MIEIRGNDGHMAGEKLIRFYRTKLSNYNLIYYFMMQHIVGFCLTMVLCLAFPIAFGLAYGINGLWMGIAIYAVLLILFYYVLIVRKARKVLWKRYRIRDFQKLQLLKLCLLRNYLARNGFQSPEELAVLQQMIEEDTTSFTKIVTIKNTAILLVVLLFVALGAVFILEANPEGHRIFLAVLLAILVVVSAVVLRGISYVVSHVVDAKKRNERALVRDIKELRASYVAQQNTEYQPYREMELVIQNNDILREIIGEKAFF
ncbi:hypothetical protein HCB26_01615 [Listeria booriae]|uniref:Uncharacterized protein n=1 Tax=Listeria booriae TaxID=1552123 RepID=A0A7X0YXF3_9LIST|nr:hypothetical protein [Listeria booriae]MBC2165271.1 hypothetical protein [Listeria booriae]